MDLALTAGPFAIEARHGYLHVIHAGSLANEEEVNLYTLAIEREAARSGVRRVLCDARAEGAEERREVRASLWRWLGTTRTLDGIAIVARDALAATRINMTALSQRLAIRAFDDPTTAVRWLTRSSRSTGSFRALSGDGQVPSASSMGLRRVPSTPPPPNGGTTEPVVIPPTPGVPRSTRQSSGAESTKRLRDTLVDEPIAPFSSDRRR